MRANGLRVAAIAVMVAGTAQAAKWKRIGTGPALLTETQVEIPVKKANVTCCEIKFKVAKGWVNLKTATVFFADGTSQEITLDEDVRPGFTSEVVKIDDKTKSIVKVELQYEAKTNSNGRAVISVLGLPA